MKEKTPVKMGKPSFAKATEGKGGNDAEKDERRSYGAWVV